MVEAYKMLEIISIEVRINSKDILLMGIYRPPKQSGNLSYSHYLESLKYQTHILIGDLNLDRTRPERRESKLLTDLEEVRNVWSPDQKSYTCIWNSKLTFKTLKNALWFWRTEQGSGQCSLECCRDVRFGRWTVRHLETIFESVLDKHMHGKKMRVRDKDIPYMTEEWKEAIKNKRKHAQVFAHRHMLKTGHSKRRAIEAYWATKWEEPKQKPKKFTRPFSRS